MNKTNPFKFGNIVSGDFFYNREDELLRIKQTLAGGNNVTLYAPRRYGKSSLVNKALNELEKEGFTTIYLDIMSVYSRDTFIKNYTRAIANKEISSIEKTVLKIAKFISGIVPSVSFDSFGMPTFSISWIEGKDKEQTLLDVINLPEKLSSNKDKWIIAFDEFQEITKLNGENFEKLLRSGIQHHQNVTYLFLGSKTHMLKDMFSNKNRAFYNAATVMSINTIEESKSVEYLVSRFKRSDIKIDSDAAMYLLQTVANIPYYIQYIAFEIWQYIILSDKHRVTKDNIDEAFERVLKLKSDYYWELTNKHTAYRKKVLYALSHSVSELFSKKTATDFDLGAVSSTQKAIDVFINEGIIERNQSKYEFSDPMYKRFVNSHL
ncbi:MAG: ATP-binding protein [Bacteroidales bacterium]|nr:ATP-binding protein [Bacteroidales bacterium]